MVAMLVDLFDLPAVLRGRKGAVVNLFDLNILQKERIMCWLRHDFFKCG